MISFKSTPKTMMPETRHILFLQGPLSPLFSLIAGKLQDDHHKVFRINFCIGDRLHWPGSGGIAYRGSIDEWPGFLAGFLAKNDITDLVLHAESRSYHKAAIKLSKQLNLNVFITELGLLRPDWMTIELIGKRDRSNIPTKVDKMYELACDLPEIDLSPKFENEFSKVAIPDIIYNLANSFLWFLYPRYQRHTIYFPPLEYAAWVKRLALKSGREKQARQSIELLEKNKIRYFVFAMQLEGDFQIRLHSPFPNISEALEYLLQSFRNEAAKDCKLILKTHPLDNGMEYWRQKLPELLSKYNSLDQFILVDGGNLGKILTNAEGMVTINSSSGLQSLQCGCPTKVLANTSYDIKGLTHTGNLYSFWNNPEKPDGELLKQFLKVLIATMQVRGTIYSDAGLKSAVANMYSYIKKGS